MMTVEIRELCCHIFQITLILTYVYSVIIDYVPQKARPIRLLHQRHLLASSALFGVFLKKICFGHSLPAGIYQKQNNGR